MLKINGATSCCVVYGSGAGQVTCARMFKNCSNLATCMFNYLFIISCIWRSNLATYMISYLSIIFFCNCRSNLALGVHIPDGWNSVSLLVFKPRLQKLNWCIDMMTNLASNRKSTGKWKIDNWQCWEFTLQGGKKQIKPDTQIPAGACRQSQGGSALPSLSSKPEI